MTQAPATLESAAAAPPASLRLVLPGESAEQTWELSPLPFVVGRSETANLQIVSNRVSREHAAFSWDGGQFWVEDVGSTNGTFFEGARIARQAIAHGDVVQVADIAVTLEVDEPPAGDPNEFVERLRRQHELLLRRGALSGFAPVRELAGSQLAACLAVVGADDSLHGLPSLPACRTSRQLHWMSLLRAVELAAELPSELPLLIELQDDSEAERWLPLIARLAERPVTARLPQSVTDEAAAALIQRIHQAGLTAAAIVEPGQELPQGVDQIWLSPAFTAGLEEDESRWQPFSELMQAVEEAGLTSLATGIADERAAQICAELDCRWAAGPMFGEPQPACALSSG